MTDTAGVFCPDCGAGLDRDDNFCRNCGREFEPNAGEELGPDG